MNATPDVPAEFAPQKITFRCQAPPDHAKLEKVCPKDQERTFVGRWVDGIRFELTELARPAPAVAAPAPVQHTSDTPPGQGGPNEQTPPATPPAPPVKTAEQLKAEADAALEEEKKRLKGLRVPDLKAEAAELAIPWDKNASLDTMIGRVAAVAIAKKKAAAEEAASGT